MKAETEFPKAYTIYQELNMERWVEMSLLLLLVIGFAGPYLINLFLPERPAEEEADHDPSATG